MSLGLGRFDVPVGQSGEHELLGALFDEAVVADVLLTVGTHALFSFDGTAVASFVAEDLAAGIDLAVTDGFVFATPQTLSTVPVPSTLWLLAPLAPWLLHRRRSGRRTTESP